MHLLNILRRYQEIFPLFGDQLQGLPHYFNFSDENERCQSYDTGNFGAFQNAVFSELSASGRSWGIGKYLENRSVLLRRFSQITAEGRTYHAGLDIVVPAGYALYAPLGGVVLAAGKEEEAGSYGGYVVLRHQLGGTVFYSLYGHLDAGHIVQPRQVLAAADPIGRVGGGSDSGQWFTHTHLQIITEQASSAGRMYHGYVTAEDVKTIELMFPSPYPLFRYRSSARE